MNSIWKPKELHRKTVQQNNIKRYSKVWQSLVVARSSMLRVYRLLYLTLSEIIFQIKCEGE